VFDQYYPFRLHADPSYSGATLLNRSVFFHHPNTGTKNEIHTAKESRCTGARKSRRALILVPIYLIYYKATHSNSEKGRYLAL